MVSCTARTSPARRMRALGPHAAAKMCSGRARDGAFATSATRVAGTEPTPSSQVLFRRRTPNSRELSAARDFGRQAHLHAQPARQRHARPARFAQIAVLIAASLLLALPPPRLPPPPRLRARRRRATACDTARCVGCSRRTLRTTRSGRAAATVHAVHAKQAVRHSLEELYRAVEDLAPQPPSGAAHERLQRACEAHIDARAHHAGAAPDARLAGVPRARRRVLARPPRADARRSAPSSSTSTART